MVELPPLRTCTSNDMPAPDCPICASGDTTPHTCPNYQVCDSNALPSATNYRTCTSNDIPECPICASGDTTPHICPNYQVCDSNAFSGGTYRTCTSNDLSGINASGSTTSQVSPDTPSYRTCTSNDMPKLQEELKPWQCSNIDGEYGCHEVETMSGPHTYTSESECKTACSNYYRCDMTQQGCVKATKDETGAMPKAQCEEYCVPWWKCENIEDSTGVECRQVPPGMPGAHKTKAECGARCETAYICDKENWQCVPTTMDNPLGQTKADCEASCVNVVDKAWLCSPIANIDSDPHTAECRPVAKGTTNASDTWKECEAMCKLHYNCEDTGCVVASPYSGASFRSLGDCQMSCPSVAPQT